MPVLSRVELVGIIEDANRATEALKEALLKMDDLDLYNELNTAITNLQAVLTPRDLHTPDEGVRGHHGWADPDQMCATSGRLIPLVVATNDVQTVLDRIRKLR